MRFIAIILALSCLPACTVTVEKVTIDLADPALEWEEVPLDHEDSGLDVPDVFDALRRQAAQRVVRLVANGKLVGIRDPDMRAAVAIGEDGRKVQELPCGLALALDSTGRVLGFGVSAKWQASHPCPLLETAGAHADAVVPGRVEEGGEVHSAREVGELDTALRPDTGSGVVRDQVRPEGLGRVGGVGSLDTPEGE